LFSRDQCTIGRGPGSDWRQTRRRPLGLRRGRDRRQTEAVSFYESLGFVTVEGIREGLMAGEPLPMFLAIGTLASLVEG
jgi:hypothetical protein